MLSYPYRQRGITAIGWLVILILVGFIALLTLKLAPIYMENYTIRMVVESLQNEPDVANKRRSDIRYMLQSRLDINYITTLPRNAIKIKKSGGKIVIDIVYEVREAIIANVDAVVSFNHHWEIVAR